MTKWFAYIALILILTPCLSFANILWREREYHLLNRKSKIVFYSVNSIDTPLNKTPKQKQQELEDKKKIKEIAKAKRLPKPEKLDEAASSVLKTKGKPKRQRRPEGLERPPEIPRRNGG